VHHPSPLTSCQLLLVASAIQSSQRLVNVQDVEGFTALHLAAMAGHAHVVSELLRHGVNLNCVTRAGQTVLHLAVCNGHLAVTALLLDRPEAAAVINMRDAQGKLPLDLAYATKSQLMIDYFDSSKRATHLKIQQLEDRAAELQSQVHTLQDEKQAAIVKHTALFKEHVTLVESSQRHAAQCAEQRRSDEQEIKTLREEKSVLVSQVEQLTARMVELETRVTASEGEQMVVEPSNLTELRNVRALRVLVY